MPNTYITELYFTFQNTMRDRGVYSEIERGLVVRSRSERCSAANNWAPASSLEDCSAPQFSCKVARFERSRLHAPCALPADCRPCAYQRVVHVVRGPSSRKSIGTAREIRFLHRRPGAVFGVHQLGNHPRPQIAVDVSEHDHRHPQIGKGAWHETLLDVRRAT
jgi:hypothetical protein